MSGDRKGTGVAWRLRRLAAVPLAMMATLGLTQCGSSGDDEHAGTVRAAHPEPTRTATPAASGRAGAASTTIALGRPAQRFEGWGATITSDTFLDPMADVGGSTPSQLRRVDRLIFRSGGVNLLRIFPPPFEDRRKAGLGRFRLMRRARAHGVRFMLTGTNTASSMRDGKALKEGQELAYARNVADLLALARRTGAPFSWVAVGNEVDNDQLVMTMTAGQAARVYAELARLIGARRLRVPLVLGDNTGWPQALEYVREELAAPGVRRRVHALASHPYTGDAPADRRAFRTLARRERRPVWMTEWTTGCPGGDCPDDLSIDGALQRFERIPRDLGEAGASTWFVLRPVADTRHGVDDGLVVREFKDGRSSYYPSKRFFVFKQFSSAGRPGSRVVSLRSSGARLPAVAFRRGRRLSLVVLNQQAESVRVRLDLGRRPGGLLARRTTATASFARLSQREYRGRSVTVTLPPASATTYHLDESKRR